MHWSVRLLTALVLTFLSIVLLLSAGAAYLIATPVGGKLLVRYTKQQFASEGVMRIGSYEGSLHNGFIIKDVDIKGLPYFPDALVRIQQINVHMPLWDLPHMVVGIFNARIFIPNSDPLVFTGKISGGQIQGNLYGNSLDLHAASRFWIGEDIAKSLTGFISRVDLVIAGPLSAPSVNGRFLIDTARYGSVIVANGYSQLSWTLQRQKGNIVVNGILAVDSGKVRVRNTDLDLFPSKLMFHGDFFNPAIDIRLGGAVEDMEVHLAIVGPMSDPQLQVSSDPPMPPQEALRVLFTGNAFSFSTSPFNGVSSGQLAENFLNYSLEDMSEDNVGLKTKLTDNLKLGVEQDQLPTPPGTINNYYSRKINGEMDMSEHMSLNVSQEILSPDRVPYASGAAASDAENEPETQVYLQYKKRF